MFVILLGSAKTLNISSNTEYEKLKILARWHTSHIKLNQVIINGLKLFQQHRSQAEALFFFFANTQTRLSMAWHSTRHDKQEADECLVTTFYVGLRFISLSHMDVAGFPTLQNVTRSNI